MRTVLIACALAAAFALAADAGAQMRPGQPRVLTPPPRESAPAVTPWLDLRAGLGTRNRVMLFWESELDGGVSTRYREVETLDREVRGRAAQVGAAEHHYGGSTEVAVAGGEAHLHERRERFTEGEGPVRGTLSGDARGLQSEFMAQLRQGGVRFIDRTLATRLAGMSVQGERPNVHAIETQGLVGHADYLMEVSSRADFEAASGRRFHVALRDVASGETLVDFETPADPPEAGPQPWVATASGFERATAPAATPADVARMLALETGRHLADTLVLR